MLLRHSMQVIDALFPYIAALLQCIPFRQHLYQLLLSFQINIELLHVFFLLQQSLPVQLCLLQKCQLFFSQSLLCCFLLDLLQQLLLLLYLLFQYSARASGMLQPYCDFFRTLHFYSAQQCLPALLFHIQLFPLLLHGIAESLIDSGPALHLEQCFQYFLLFFTFAC